MLYGTREGSEIGVVLVLEVFPDRPLAQSAFSAMVGGSGIHSGERSGHYGQ